VWLLVCLFGFSVAILQLPIDQWKGKRVLFVVAHPDDIEGLAGGTVSLLTAQGTIVEYLIMTNGDKGGYCYNTTSFFTCTSPDIAVTRRREQLNAAQYLGVKNVHFLDLEDGMLTSYSELQIRVQVTVVIRSYQPHVVIAWFPYPDFTAPPLKKQCPNCWSDLGYHPDHQCSGRICMDAVIGPSASLNTMFQELTDAGLEAWSVEEYYTFGLINGATHYMDIEGVPFQRKCNSFLLHTSQFLNQTDLVKQSLSWIGQQLGTVSGSKLAENFISFN